MIKHQLIEKSTEVIWMFLLISFWLFVDLWLRIFHNISIFEITKEWFRSNFELFDGMGITVGFTVFMAGIVPGVRFALPLIIMMIYLQLCSWFNWDVRTRKVFDYKNYYVKESDIKSKAISNNNGTLYSVYISHLETKSSIIKQQTICISIISLLLIGYLLPQTSDSVLTYLYNGIESLIWYLEYPLNLLLSGFLFYIFGLSAADYRHLDFIDKKNMDAAEKHNKRLWRQ